MICHETENETFTWTNINSQVSFEPLTHCHLIYIHFPQAVSLVLVMFIPVIARRTDSWTCLISRYTLTQLQKKGTQFREENNAKSTGDGEECWHQNIFSKTGAHEICFWYILSVWRTDLCMWGKHENSCSQLRIQEALHYFSHVGTISGNVLGMGRSQHFALMSEDAEAGPGKVLPRTVPAMSGDEPWLYSDCTHQTWGTFANSENQMVLETV